MKLIFLKMKIKQLTINCLACAILFVGCKKIDLELQVLDKYPAVVEARMTNLQELELHLSQVVPLSHPDSVISGAYVEITPLGGAPEQLEEVAPGHYRLSLTALPGQRYTLRIEAGGKVLLATAVAPAAAISVDSVAAKRMDDSTAVLTTHLRLPPTRPIYALLSVKTDSATLDEYFIEKTIEPGSVFLHESQPVNVQPGTSVQVEITTFSKTDFEFYRAVGRLSLGNNFNPSNVRNPPSNISGEAIGLFSAALADTISLQVW